VVPGLTALDQFDRPGGETGRVLVPEEMALLDAALLQADNTAATAALEEADSPQ